VIPNFVNLTPHAITIRVGERDIVVPPSGQVARVAVRSVDRAPLVIAENAGEFTHVPVVGNEYGSVEGLPDPAPLAEAKVFIVSALVLGRVFGRSGDVFAPDTGPTAVRDEKGQIKAVTRLIGASY